MRVCFLPHILSLTIFDFSSSAHHMHDLTATLPLVTAYVALPPHAFADLFFFSISQFSQHALDQLSI